MHINSWHWLNITGIEICILLGAIVCFKGLRIGYQHLSESAQSRTVLMRLFGYNTTQRLTEFLILKITLQIFVVVAASYFMVHTLDTRRDLINRIYGALINGIPFANTTLYPTRLVTGLIVACCLYLISRSLTARFRQQCRGDEEEKQIAIASILSYIGFSLALITGLLIAGFDFTSLAIVTGALSVGIGLGLQSIVNNFVSGLILLIEKPIKPGDRIQIDGVDGTVKKISVRSTQLTTAAHEDIIIPNSDLITRRVTNYTYSDTLFSINCQVGVAYGSDTLRVRDLLLEIANAHEEVIVNSRNKPSVIFHAFGENALIFQLWCLIKHVNKKISVQSDLNFSIERCFREQGIRIAYPQRDVHLNIHPKDLDFGQPEMPRAFVFSRYRP